jgi:hypothetical protein
MRHRRSRKRLALAVVAALAAISVYAAAAGISFSGVPAGGFMAGQGSTPITGYTVSNVVYNLNASNAQNIDRVDFTLDHAATWVQIELISGGASWYPHTNCTNNHPGANDWQCDTTSGGPGQATVNAANTLEVVAKNS